MSGPWETTTFLSQLNARLSAHDVPTLKELRDARDNFQITHVETHPVFWSQRMNSIATLVNNEGSAEGHYRAQELLLSDILDLSATVVNTAETTNVVKYSNIDRGQAMQDYLAVINSGDHDLIREKHDAMRGPDPIQTNYMNNRIANIAKELDKYEELSGSGNISEALDNAKTLEEKVNAIKDIAVQLKCNILNLIGIDPSEDDSALAGVGRVRLDKATRQNWENKLERAEEMIRRQHKLLGDSDLQAAQHDQFLSNAREQLEKYEGDRDEALRNLGISLEERQAVLDQKEATRQAHKNGQTHVNIDWNAVQQTVQKVYGG